jgi:hypothetical protein
LCRYAQCHDPILTASVKGYTKRSQVTKNKVKKSDFFEMKGKSKLIAKVLLLSFILFFSLEVDQGKRFKTFTAVIYIREQQARVLVLTPRHSAL